MLAAAAVSAPIVLAQKHASSLRVLPTAPTIELMDDSQAPQAGPLAGRTIAIPETRELEVFASMLERRGANVVRCPLIAIRDAPDPQPVLEWCRKFAAGEYDDLILLTGEGLRRILSCMDRHEPALRAPFIAQLARVRKITRGPKPARALREVGLKPDVPAEIPTTDGVIASLRTQPLAGRRIGLQLYGTHPNRPLVAFLENAGATVAPVAPYVYADQAEDDAVLDLLRRLEAREIDAIAFTSTAQIRRLFDLAPEERVRAALDATRVAAIGPVVAETLESHGVHVHLMPVESFFLKPLTTGLEHLFSDNGTSRS
jgi:uroporphyrinogen-III synthase